MFRLLFDPGDKFDFGHTDLRTTENFSFVLFVVADLIFLAVFGGLISKTRLLLEMPSMPEGDFLKYRLASISPNRDRLLL